MHSPYTKPQTGQSGRLVDGLPETLDTGWRGFFAGEGRSGGRLRKECAMAEDENEDLYDEEFDFVDDDDDEEFDGDSDTNGQTATAGKASDDRERDDLDDKADRGEDEEPEDEPDDEPEDEYGRTAPKPDYVVHIYEHEKFKRTIDRPFTPEDADAFATEFNRTGKSYGRVAVTSKNDAKPKKTLG